jgi:hypothetical protein
MSSRLKTDGLCVVALDQFVVNLISVQSILSPFYYSFLDSQVNHVDGIENTPFLAYKNPLPCLNRPRIYLVA